MGSGGVRGRTSRYEPTSSSSSAIRKAVWQAARLSIVRRRDELAVGAQCAACPDLLLLDYNQVIDLTDASFSERCCNCLRLTGNANIGAVDVGA